MLLGKEHPNLQNLGKQLRLWEDRFLIQHLGQVKWWFLVRMHLRDNHVIQKLGMTIIPLSLGYSIQDNRM